jgi:hypothetical protein
MNPHSFIKNLLLLAMLGIPVNNVAMTSASASASSAAAEPTSTSSSPSTHAADQALQQTASPPHGTTATATDTLERKDEKKSADLTHLQEAVKKRNWTQVARQYGHRLPIYKSDAVHNLILILKNFEGFDLTTTMLAPALYEKAAPIIVSGVVFKTYLTIRNNRNIAAAIAAVQKKPSWTDTDLLLASHTQGAVFAETILALIPCSPNDWYGFFNKTSNLVVLIPKAYVSSQVKDPLSACGFDEKNLEPLDFKNPQLLSETPLQNTMLSGFLSLFKTTTTVEECKPSTAGSDRSKGSNTPTNSQPSWNICCIGHGQPSEINNDVFDANSAWIAGMKFSTFKDFVSFLHAKLPVLSLHCITCFAGGRNKDFLANMLQTINPNFSVILHGTSDMSMYVSGLEQCRITGDNTGTVDLQFHESFDFYFKLFNTYFLHPQSFITVANDMGLHEPVQFDHMRFSKTNPLEPTPTMATAMVGLVDRNRAMAWNALPIIYNPYQQRFDPLEIEDIAILTKSKLRTRIAHHRPFYAHDKQAIIIGQGDIPIPLILGNRTVVISRLPVELTDASTETKSPAVASTYTAKHHIYTVVAAKTPLWQLLTNFTTCNVSAHTIFAIDYLYCKNYAGSGIETKTATTEFQAHDVVIEIHGQHHMYTASGVAYPGQIDIALRVGSRRYHAHWRHNNLHAEVMDAEGLRFEVQHN